jgi:xanthine dehydrogenase small subunit
MISFILNNKLVNTDKSPGGSLLDFIRYEMDLPGTKCGCREGDCGACSVLEGEYINGRVNYKSIVTCLTPLANIHGKHIVTIEGLNMKQLSPVQKAVADNSATQCGFCTPGIVVSLTSFCLSSEKPDFRGALAAVSGNICRCTGYKSIEKASAEITDLVRDKTINNPVEWLVTNKFLPDYFLTIPGRLSLITPMVNGSESDDSILLGGGTDLMVKRAAELLEKEIIPLSYNSTTKGIFSSNGKCIIGASSSLSEIGKSELLNRYIPGLSAFLNLIASEQIRNTGTLAGNIVNASPAADPVVIFLALRSTLSIAGKDGKVRSVLLKDFYKGYKKTDLGTDETIINISFRKPEQPELFNFEKVSRRTNLDIASVNSAISITIDGELIKECSISAGGVSPVPLFPEKTSSFLEGKPVTSENILAAASILQEEISPISDIRGSEAYKRLLMRQLFFAHFIKLFPGTIDISGIT